MKLYKGVVETTVKFSFKGISKQYLESMNGNRFGIVGAIVGAIGTVGTVLPGFWQSLATALAMEALTGGNKKKG